MSGKFTITVRFNLDKDEDCSALGYLQGMGKGEYGSLNRAVITAVNGFYERKSRLADDPYLETREKEDAFLRRVLETVERSLQGSAFGLLSLLPMRQDILKPPVPAVPAEQEDNKEDLDIALDFISGL